MPWAAGCIILILAAIIVYVRINAARGVDLPLREDLVSSVAKTGELLVIVHGYNGNIRSMRDVREAAREERPDADLLFLEFSAQPLSNADCVSLSEKIGQAISKYDKENDYNHIRLIGYSVGALLLRKAYVYGYGHVEDITPEAELPSELRAPMEWVQKVDRIVLLAGMNRGWTLRKKPRAMRWDRAICYRLGTLFGKLTGTARLIRQCERGEPFVANLRVQWLKVIHSLPEEKQPIVIQLLGRVDDVVGDEDNRDVAVCKDFVFVPVNGTGHMQAIQFKDSPYAQERRRKFMAALGDEDSVEQLRRESLRLPDDTDVNVMALVVVLHGIRDMGEWTSQFENPLQEAFRKKHANDDKLFVHHASYGYFAMGPFLLWADRQKNVRWFMDELTELKAKYPKLNEVDFIGHSNGTYVLASALRKYKTMRINRAVFAGSVVRRDFDWDIVKDRISGGIRNYVGSKDWVVGLFPRLFELPLFNVFNRDIGSAGFNGFEGSFGNAAETRFINGFHSAALQPSNIQSVVDFIVDGNVSSIDRSIVVPRHPVLLDYSSRLCWLVWLGIGLFLFALGICWVWISCWLSTKMSLPWCRGIGLTTYLLFVWLLLKTL
jgi:pimeloyl-ACP methyl ester carboxylesterase